MPLSTNFSWNGLPQYAAQQLDAAIAEIDQDYPVSGSRALVPIVCGGRQEARRQRRQRPQNRWVDPSLVSVRASERSDSQVAPS